MVIEVTIAAGVALMGYIVARQVGKKKGDGLADPDDNPVGDDDAPGDSPKAAKAAARAANKAADKAAKLAAKAQAKADALNNSKPSLRRARRRRGLKVGDVLLYADTEFWLSGVVDLDEEGFVVAVFNAPGGLRYEWVAQLDEDGDDIALLNETTDVPGGVVPERLPIDGIRMSLKKRGHAEVMTEGEGLPLLGSRCEYVIMSGVGGKSLIVLDFDEGDRIALFGERVGRELLELLPGGDVID